MSEFPDFLFKEFIVVVFDLGLLEEGPAGHQHETFLVLELLLEVILLGTHPHPHLEYLGIELGGADIVSLLQLVPLSCGCVEHFPQLAVLLLQLTSILQRIAELQLIQLLYLLQVSLVQGSHLHLHQLTLPLEV